jgi:hypothetical protein
MKKFSENTGHRENGEWINETPQAKLRNQLGPFWTLVTSMILDKNKNHSLEWFFYNLLKSFISTHISTFSYEYPSSTSLPFSTKNFCNSSV